MRGRSPKGNGIVGGKLKPLEVVAICGHLITLGADDENLPGDARGDDECRRFSLLRDDALPLTAHEHAACRC